MLLSVHLNVFLLLWGLSYKVFHDKIMSMADVDAEEAVVTFDGIAVLTPRCVKHPTNLFDC